MSLNPSGSSANAILRFRIAFARQIHGVATSFPSMISSTHSSPWQIGQTSESCEVNISSGVDKLLDIVFRFFSFSFNVIFFVLQSVPCHSLIII